MESNEDGASTIDGNAMEQSEPGDTNDVDPEKGKIELILTGAGDS